MTLELIEDDDECYLEPEKIVEMLQEFECVITCRADTYVYKKFYDGFLWDEDDGYECENVFYLAIDPDIYVMDLLTVGDLVDAAAQRLYVPKENIILV